MMVWHVQLTILGEVFLAMVLGGIIGLERGAANKPAGFRTHMLVSGSAALLVGLSNTLVAQFGAEVYFEYIRSDPIRVIEAIIAGVSFLGAGTIFKHPGRHHVEGLTTAASLLFSAAIGVAVALRQFLLAVAVASMTLIVLRGVDFIEKRIKQKNQS